MHSYLFIITPRRLIERWLTFVKCSEGTHLHKDHALLYELSHVLAGKTSTDNQIMGRTRSEALYRV